MSFIHQTFIEHTLYAGAGDTAMNKTICETAAFGFLLSGTDILGGENKTTHRHTQKKHIWVISALEIKSLYN